eukprot:2173-Rhodomonas_salina.4
MGPGRGSARQLRATHSASVGARADQVPDDWRLQELILLVVLDELADALWSSHTRSVSAQHMPHHIAHASCPSARHHTPGAERADTGASSPGDLNSLAPP